MDEGPPEKPKSATRFIAKGCIAVIVIAVVIAGLAGVALYKVSKGMDEVARIGSDWLARQPEAETEFGGMKIERIATPFNVQIRNDEGDAWFEYRVTGTKASGEARIFLLRRQKDWRAVAARLRVGGREVPVGTPP